MIEESPQRPQEQASEATVARLRLQLADSERRLAELTEHSLQILDRLTEARSLERERGELFARIAELQELLADTRQRIRLASRAVLAKGLEAQAAHEVVVWGLGAGDADRLDRLLAALPETPVTMLLQTDTDPAPFARQRAALSVHAPDWRAPSHAWNEAMALTQAPVVVMLTPDAVPSRRAIARLAAAAAADGIAVASPCLVHPAGRALGRVESAVLEMVPFTTPETAGVEAVPFPSPEAFAIAREAFHRLGAFDQDLRGDLSLAEWTMRGASRSWRCVGVADAEVHVSGLRPDAADAASAEGDRMVILSRHRPQQLAAAAASARELWERDPSQLAEVLGSVFRRLPHAAELSGAIDLLVVQAQSLAGWKRVAPAIRERLAALARELGVAVPEPLTEPGLVHLGERVHGAVAQLREQVRELEARCLAIPELQSDLQQHGVEVRALRQDIVARSNTIDALREELLERERAIASLREELGHRTGERDRLIDHLASVQQDLERSQEAARELLERRRGEHEEASAAAEARIAALQQELASQDRRLQTALGELDELGTGNARLRREQGALQEQRLELESRAHDLVVALREREQWLVRLLGEVRGRRLWRRRLTPAELEFLRRQGIDWRP